MSFNFTISNIYFDRNEINSFYSSEEGKLKENYSRRIIFLIHSMTGIRSHVYRANVGSRIVTFYVRCIKCKQSYKIQGYRDNFDQSEMLAMEIKSNKQKCNCKLNLNNLFHFFNEDFF